MPPEIDEQETERERQRFLTALSRRQGPDNSEPSWQPPIEVHGVHLALLAARRLKDISVYLLFFAFLLAILARLRPGGVAGGGRQRMRPSSSPMR